jgi:hypothetical protein
LAQEFTINSSQIETKINQLLPSQGGFGAGVDFSASTMVIPIVDLTETAEGSGLRQDLQSSLSFSSQTAFNVNNATSTIINTTGYFRIFGTANFKSRSASSDSIDFIINDGTTDKSINNMFIASGQDNNYLLNNFDFIILLQAGHSFKITASFNGSVFGSTRQLADLQGNLTAP